MQIFLSKLKVKKISTPRFLRGLKYVGLAIIVLIIIITKNSQAFRYEFLGLSLGQIFIARAKNIIFVIFLTGMALSVFSYRFFCHNLCPIRALSASFDKLRKNELR